jgi:flagellar FliL protein
MANKDTMPERADDDIDDDIEGDEAEGAAEAEAGKAKRKIPGKLLVLFIGAPVLVLALIVGGLFAFGVFGGDDEVAMAGQDAETGAETRRLDASQVIFVDLPEILVNLNSSERGQTYLKLKVALEVDRSVDPGRLMPLMPRIVDKFQVYLREMRIEDLNGSAGMFRLKEELRRRVNVAVHPIEVHDVLFKEMIVQ